MILIMMFLIVFSSSFKLEFEKLVSEKIEIQRNCVMVSRSKSTDYSQTRCSTCSLTIHSFFSINFLSIYIDCTLSEIVLKLNNAFFLYQV